MILEIAQIDIRPGMEGEFEARVSEAVPLLRRARGCISINLRRSIERPSRYRLLVEWETIENHIVDFQGSQDFKEWRRLLGPCFEQIPEVEHMTETLLVPAA
jgi:quinol monooxygenase YgiN